MKISRWLVLVLALVWAPPALASNPVQAENALQGDSYWTAATQDGLTPNPPIDGYASATSVRPGETIGFHVTAVPGSRYRIEIDRLGWYGGLGGRRITCLVGAVLDPMCSHNESGVQQPPAPSPDPVTGEVDAGWSTTDTLAVPAGWTSGYYLAVFRLTAGPSAGQTAFTPFIVQAPAGDHSTILVQVPTNTWQAYNPWGGEDLYSTPRAVKVSFNRPYANRLLFDWEYPLVRFLERGGWDVSYATDDDVDADPSILLGHALDMSAGHDEYWTKQMRDGWEAARDAGVNLAFMGANDGFWQVRYEDGHRAIVAYKYSPDPDPDLTETTTEFRELATPRPECELMGVQFGGTVLYRQYLDYTVDPAAASDPWFAGSGLTAGSVLPGLVGYETDSIVPGCHVPPPTPLLNYSGPPAAPGQPPVQADAVRYTACSGAEVFATGSLQFSWGLDSWRDPSYAAAGLPPEPSASLGLQQAMTTALEDLTRSHVPIPGPPDVCVPTPSYTASVRRAVPGQAVTFDSTSTDQYGEIAGHSWDFAGSGAFENAGGSVATHSFSAPGLFEVSLRVTDSSGASATATHSFPVCRCPPGQTPSAWRSLGADPVTCEGAEVGSLRRRHRQLLFSPYTGIGAVTVRKYQLILRTDGSTRRRLLAAFTTEKPVLLRLAHPAPPYLIEVSGRVGTVPLREQFVLPAPGAGIVAPSSLIATACNGAVAHVLTPLFGGAEGSPLQVLVAARGRVAVSLMRPGGAVLVRRVMGLRGHPVVIAFPGGALTRGRYDVAVAIAKAGMSGLIVLSAWRM